MSRESVLPIKIDSTSSNGEYAPLRVGNAVTRANPALSPDVKVNVFGRSAATVYGVDPSPARRRAEVDPVSRLRAAYREAGARRSRPTGCGIPPSGGAATPSTASTPGPRGSRTARLDGPLGSGLESDSVGRERMERGVTPP